MPCFTACARGAALAGQWFGRVFELPPDRQGVNAPMLRTFGARDKRLDLARLETLREVDQIRRLSTARPGPGCTSCARPARGENRTVTYLHHSAEQRPAPLAAPRRRHARSAGRPGSSPGESRTVVRTSASGRDVRRALRHRRIARARTEFIPFGAQTLNGMIPFYAGARCP